MPSYYDTLQVIPTASDGVIKAAYRALARIYHPDLNPDNAEAEATMQNINRAYHILSNPSSRAQYDIQNGLRDFYPDVVETIVRAPSNSTSNQPSAHEPSEAGYHYAQPNEYPPQRIKPRPAKWALGLFFFGAAAIFSVIVLPNWQAPSNRNVANSARLGEAQALNLRLDTAPLSLPDKFSVN